jgi:hypothetical protein
MREREQGQACPIPPLQKEAWLRHQQNGPVPLKGADGMVRSETSPNPDHPVRSLSGTGIFLEVAAAPPFAKRGVVLLLLLFSMFVPVSLPAQDAPRGVALPFTVTGGLVVSERPQAEDPDASGVTAGFRAVFNPSLKVNSRWYVYSAIQVHSRPFFYYESFYPSRALKSQLQQLFVGYSVTGENSAFGFKVGKLPTAFGSFPLRYQDTANPLLDQPFGYAYKVKLRPDQLPCDVDDLVHQQQYAVYVHHYCGGSSDYRSGMVPVTLYGLPGAEVNLSWKRLDARFQLSNSSPANPQDLRSDSQHIQWTAGAGYTIRQGFRMGVSGFRGPFLEEDVRSLLISGTSPRDYPAAGIGTDLQWGRGRWGASAELQRVEFNYPDFRVPPSVWSGYAEFKATLNPRFYAALRAGYEGHGRVEDSGGTASTSYLPNRQSYEFALGYRLNRIQTLKFGYEWLKTNGVAGTRNNVIGVQFVTSVHSLSKAF